jgi:hypothetical protein
VIGKTLGIGMIILTLEFWIGYQIFVSGFWRRFPSRAILIHILGGVALPATIAFGMILLSYPASIVDDVRFQWDILFMLLLLIILNFWLANRLFLHEVKLMQDIKDNLVSAHDKLNQQVAFLQAEINHYKHDAQKYELLLTNADKTVHGLIEGKDMLTLQLDGLRTENNRLMVRVQQLEVDKSLEVKSRILAEDLNQELMLEIAELKVLVNNEDEVAGSNRDRPAGVLHFKVKDTEIAIFEPDIAYCYGHHRKGEDSYQEIVLMDGTKYHPGLKSLSDLLRAFPALKHVSRNYLIAGQAILAYRMLPGNTPLLTILHLDQAIEYGESYRRKKRDWKDWLVRQVAINQKNTATVAAEVVVVGKDRTGID